MESSVLGIARPGLAPVSRADLITHNPPPAKAARPVPTHSREGTPGRQQRTWRVLRGLWRGLGRLTQLEWPKNFPIVQFPNAPLIIAFLAGQAASHTHGSAHAYAAGISYLAMTIWAYEELVHGVNWFRRLLGLGYGISTVVHLALALQR